MNKLIEFIKKIKLYFYNSHLSSLKEGDIIWAKRYSTEKEKLSIKEGHRESPFVIIYKDRNKVYGLKCTSNPKDNSYVRVKLNKELYGLSKDSYVYTLDLILLNKERYIYYINHLLKEDMDAIHKSMDIYRLRGGKNIDLYPQEKIVYDINPGDIVIYKDKDYYVDNKDSNYYYLIPIYRRINGNIIINNRNYDFNFKQDKLRKIPINKKLQIENITDKNTRDLIKLYKAKELLKQKERKILKRGKLIFYGCNMYLIYGEHEDKFLVYKVYNDNKHQEEILIDKCKYYTSFEEDILSKGIEAKILRNASEIEMENIKKIKKTNKKSEKIPKIKVKPYYKNMTEGSIVIADGTLDKYLIIKRIDNTIYFVSLDGNRNIYFYDLTGEKPLISFSEKMNKLQFAFEKEKYTEEDISFSKSYIKKYE